MATPVILDTDIGSDIDDTWALVHLLRATELDLKLVTVGTGDTPYRARLVARLLQLARRGDIPIGVGPESADSGVRFARQGSWCAGVDLAGHPGGVHADGVQALIDTVMRSPEPVTIIGIGPVTNIGIAVQREPRIAERARVILMAGSIAVGNNDAQPGPSAEYNVVKDIPAAQAVFAAPWPIAITPLDSCGDIRLLGERYRAVVESPDPLLRAVMENYRAWRANGGWVDPEHGSSILFDTVAVYMAYAVGLLDMRAMKLRIDHLGYTREAVDGRLVEVAMGWRDREGYYDHLLGRLLGRAGVEAR